MGGRPLEKRRTDERRSWPQWNPRRGSGARLRLALAAFAAIATPDGCPAQDIVHAHATIPCAALVELLGCDAQLPGAAAAIVRADCAAECPSAGGAHDCGPGTAFRPANATANVSAACLDCAPGSYSAFGDGACELCPAGTHQNVGGAHRCFDCPVGRFEDRAGQAECTQCPARSSTCKLQVHAQFNGLQEDCLSGANSADACAH